MSSVLDKLKLIDPDLNHDYEITSTMTLNSCHIPYDVINNAYAYRENISSNEYCTTFPVDTYGDEEKTDPTLDKLARIAMLHGCAYIAFDQDADVWDHLEEFDW